MRSAAQHFKSFAFQAADQCGFTLGRVFHEFGLKDLLDNGLKLEDDAATVAVKALTHFCDDESTSSDVFQFAAIAVCSFLNSFSTDQQSRGGKIDQAAIDLISIYNGVCNKEVLRAWIKSNFNL